MGTSSIFAVILAVIASFSITGTQSIGPPSSTFTLKNNCPYKVWPGAQDDANSSPLGLTGFELNPGANFSVKAPAGWDGLFWARTHCSTSNGRFTCKVGDCGTGQVSCNGADGAPPVSLARFRLLGGSGKDFYDISLVEGFNIQLSIEPQGCPTINCLGKINQDCPRELAVRNANGVTIACKSACTAFGNEKYCCTGAHSKPETCQATTYSTFFKNRCPQAYSYLYDQTTTTFTCPSGGDYLITFCPK